MLLTVTTAYGCWGGLSDTKGRKVYVGPRSNEEDWRPGMNLGYFDVKAKSSLLPRVVGRCSAPSLNHNIPALARERRPGGPSYVSEAEPSRIAGTHVSATETS